MLTKSYTDIIKEAASLEEFSVSNVVEDELKHACRECIKDIPVISKEVVGYSAHMVPVFANEGAYYVDLPDLVKFMNTKEITDIMEAMEEVADANEISVSEMSLVLESKEYMESVIETAADVSKAGDATMLEDCELAVKFINMIISEGVNVCMKVDSINEGLTIESWNEDKLKKMIKKYENTLEDIEKKKAYFESLPASEQRSYCTKKAIKNVFIAAAINIPTLFAGGVVYNYYITMKGNNTILGPKNYKQQLNELIVAYNTDIKKMKKRLKELESEK